MMNRTCGDEGKWKQKRKTDVWTGTREKEKWKDSVEHCHAARSTLDCMAGGSWELRVLVGPLPSVKLCG